MGAEAKLPQENTPDAKQLNAGPGRVKENSWLDAATLSVFSHGLSTLVLAVRMSVINIERMSLARRAGKKAAKEAVRQFHTSTYYTSWSRAQLNNTEYAPMLALLCLCLKYKAHRSARRLTFSEGAACIASVASSLLFVYA